MTQPQPANAHRLAIGDFTLTTLMDGQFEAGLGVLLAIVGGTVSAKGL